MNGSPGNPDWNQMRALLTTVEAGSLSAAAKRLGLTQPTLGRQVAALEESLGLAIFERVGRNLVLTEAGQRLVADLRDMGAAAERVALSAAAQSQSVEGVVRITTADIYAGHVLPPLLQKIRREAPGIIVQVLAVGQISDLLRREADIAIRNTDPGHPDLIARKICDDAGHLYGTRAYLDGLSDLSQAEIIGFDWTDLLRQRLSQMGHIFAPEQFTVTSANHLVQLAMVQAGVGLGVFPTHVGQTHGLIKAVPDAPPMLYPVWLVAHKELRTSRRVRLVFDLLASGISARLKP